MTDEQWYTKRPTREQEPPVSTWRIGDLLDTTCASLFMLFCMLGSLGYAKTIIEKEKERGKVKETERNKSRD